jgi:hypothetical protein
MFVCIGRATQPFMQHEQWPLRTPETQPSGNNLWRSDLHFPYIVQMKRLACGWCAVRYVCVTALEGSCSEISARHWLTAFSGVQTKLITYVHFRKISCRCSLHVQWCTSWEIILYSYDVNESIIFDKAAVVLRFRFFTQKRIVLYWSTEIQHVRKHCAVTSPILSVVRLSTDKQFTTWLGRNGRESDWRWCQVTQLCVSLSLHLDRSNVTKYGNSLRVQLCVRLSTVRRQQSHVSLQPAGTFTPVTLQRPLRSLLTVHVFLAANRMTRRARKHDRLLPRTFSFIFHPSIRHWTLCSLCQQTKTLQSSPYDTPRKSRGAVETYPNSFFNLGSRWGTVVKATIRPLYTREKTQYLLYRRLGVPQGRSGPARKISPTTGIRSQDRPNRIESQYRLSYPGALHCHLSSK